MTDREFWMGPDFPRQPQEVLERLKTYGACVAADAMKGFNAMNGSIQPVAPGRCVCGCAVTVRLRPGDNLLLHKAIEAARPGDILVLDTNSSYRNAVIGGIMCGAAFGKGIGGLVVDAPSGTWRSSAPTAGRCSPPPWCPAPWTARAPAS